MLRYGFSRSLLPTVFFAASKAEDWETKVGWERPGDLSRRRREQLRGSGCRLDRPKPLLDGRHARHSRSGIAWTPYVQKISPHRHYPRQSCHPVSEHWRAVSSIAPLIVKYQHIYLLPWAHLKYFYRLVIWADWDTVSNRSATIQASITDGTERRTLVKGDLHWPSGLTVDHLTSKLYWYVRLDRRNHCHENESNCEKYIFDKITFSP